MSTNDVATPYDPEKIKPSCQTRNLKLGNDRLLMVQAVLHSRTKRLSESEPSPTGSDLGIP